MRSQPIVVVLASLLACGAVVSAVFLDEAALSELAEREGYALTLHAVQRARRQAPEQCRCPPPPPFAGDDDDQPPPPPPSGPESSGDDERPRPRPAAGCWPPPPPPGPWGPHRGGRPHHRWGAQAYNGPPCELRPLFRIPDKFNFTARVVCFDRWERESAKQMGMTPEDRFDVTKYKPTHRKSLMWNKGCDMQCHFMELGLTNEDGDNLVVDSDALSGLLKEEGDSSDITMAVDSAVETCLKMAAEMVHAKQVCQTGADEILFCLQRTLEDTCPGSKWQGQRSCDEVADAPSKLRTCWNMRRMMHPHPHHPPPFDGHRGPPPHHMRPMGPVAPAGDPGTEWPSPPVQPNTITPDESRAANSDA